jgi:predicted esterase
VVIVLIGAAVVCIVICYELAPSGKTAAGAKLQSVFPPGTHYRRWTPNGLVPEIDQVKMGSDLSPFADAIMTRAKAVRMKHLFLTAYREMQHDPDFVSVGSAMGDVFSDMLGLRFNAGHLYAYIPEHKPGEKLPVILFLHGAGGNFKAFVWNWKRLADSRGIAIVAPSFGCGSWHHRGGMEAIDIAYEYCRRHPELDSQRIILAGLSNGGIGVSRAMCLNPERYCGLVYISPVLEPDVVGSPVFLQACAGKPILVLHGDEDERIPRRYVEEPLRSLAGKVSVEAKYYAGEDHFLILSKRDEVLEQVGKWMGKEMK